MKRRPTTPIKITQPRPLPGEVPWLPPANYDCTRGHYVQADRPVRRCPSCVLGEPCDGELVPVGKGARTTAVAS